MLEGDAAEQKGPQVHADSVEERCGWFSRQCDAQPVYGAALCHNLTSPHLSKSGCRQSAEALVQATAAAAADGAATGRH